MLVRIPEHLKKLKIVSDLANLIEAYAQYQEENGSLDDEASLHYYFYYSSITGVRKFLEFYFSSSREGKTPSELDALDRYIDYLEARFFAVKGTLNVFEYLKTILGLDFDYSYTTSSLKITINKLNTEDSSVFNEYFMGFLGDLLYFAKQPDLEVLDGTLELSGDIQIEISYASTTYLEQNVTEYDS